MDVNTNRSGGAATYLYKNIKNKALCLIQNSNYMIANGDKNIEQTPAEKLMHELYGHAIPYTVPSKDDYPNAKEADNEIRKECGLELRPIYPYDKK